MSKPDVERVAEWLYLLDIPIVGDIDEHAQYICANHPAVADAILGRGPSLVALDKLQKQLTANDALLREVYSEYECPWEHQQPVSDCYHCGILQDIKKVLGGES